MEEMAKKGMKLPPRESNIKNVAKTFFHQLKGLLTNITFLLNVFSISTGAIVVIGLVTFSPKYVESQFSYPASQANLLLGGTGVAGGGRYPSYRPAGNRGGGGGGY